ncbi:MAG: lysophospholipid acyltransferase family protein [Actinomycetota bacterium]|nr:lysophospholipid acyltransferase family protein [Actinomycetota bacterium]
MNEELQARAQAVASSSVASVVYRLTRAFIRVVLWSYFRLGVSGREHLTGDAALIIAPVHRSNLDSFLLAPLTRRRFRSLAKESLFQVRPLAWFMAALGAFPVRRGSADRESLRAARLLLDEGATLLVFPEGGRQQGDEIGELFDGAAYLAARTGAPVVPVGIAGTEEAMAQGVRLPRPCRVQVVVGPALPPPDRSAKRSALRAWTADLLDNLQSAQQAARSRL